MPDYQGFMRIAGIGGEPLRVGTQTIHRSVVIYLAERPSDELLRRWLDRARAYLADPQKYGSHEFTTEAVFTCPFCTLEVHIVRDSTSEPALIHAMPPCKRYLDLDVVDYMQAVNREMAKTAPS